MARCILFFFSILFLLTNLAYAFEYNIPSYQDSHIKARFRLTESPLFISIGLTNHDFAKSYITNIFDSSSCSDLSKKFLVYSKSPQGSRLLNDYETYDLLTIEFGPRQTMGVFKGGGTEESLQSSVRGKVVAVREEPGGVIVSCGVLP